MSIFRQIFGPGRKEIWQQLAADMGAQYIPGTIWKSDKVQLAHGPWLLTLDIYNEDKQVYTRMRAPFVNPDQFRFKVYRRGIFTELGRIFGIKSVDIGQPDFECDHVIKGNDERKLRALLSSAKIRSLIASQPRIILSIKGDPGVFGPAFPPRTEQLHYRSAGLIRNPERLRALFTLFTGVLDELCRIGVTTREDPGVKL